MTIQRTTETVRVTIQPAMTIEELIVAGQYGYVYRRSYLHADNFPLGIGDDVAAAVDLTLICFNTDLLTEAVEAEIDAANFRSSRLRRFLHIGVQHGDLQRRFPIATLGDPWMGPHSRRYDPRLIGGSEYSRHLDLGWTFPGFSWQRNCRFVVEPK